MPDFFKHWAKGFLTKQPELLLLAQRAKQWVLQNGFKTIMSSRYRGHYPTVNLHPMASGHVSQEHGYLFLKSPAKTDVSSAIRLCTPQGERKGYI